MANEQNLKPLSTEKAREIGSKGGKASAEARRRKRDLRIALELLLEKDMKTKDGKSMSGTEAITAKLFQRALDGDVNAFKTIRETVGQDPVQKIEVNQIDREQSRQELEDIFNDE